MEFTRIKKITLKAKFQFVSSQNTKLENIWFHYGTVKFVLSIQPKLLTVSIAYIFLISLLLIVLNWFTWSFYTCRDRMVCKSILQKMLHGKSWYGLVFLTGLDLFSCCTVPNRHLKSLCTLYSCLELSYLKWTEPKT